MIGFVLSLIAGLYIFLSQQPANMATFCLIMGFFFLTVALFAVCVMWSSIQRVNEKVCSAALPLFFQDFRFLFSLCLLFAFCLFSLTANLSSRPVFFIWILGFGISFDITCFFLQRIRKYSDPLFLLEKMPKQVVRALRNEEEAVALGWINQAFEIIDKAMHAHKFTIATFAIDTSRTMAEEYVQQLARIELLSLPTKGEMGPSFLDKVTLLSAMVCEKLRWLYMRAIKEEMNPVWQAITSCFGKLSIFLSRHNTKSAILPLQYLSKCAINAGEDALIQATLTLGETCKSLLRLSLEKRESFKESIVSCLLNMEEMVKLFYKRNKESNVALLIQPFAEVAQALGSDEMQQVLQRDEILSELRRIFSQFESLQVLSAGISELVPQDTSSSFEQDIVKE
jgi:hypothetical protein